jgi:hypothetical protein
MKTNNKMNINFYDGFIDLSNKYCFNNKLLVDVINEIYKNEIYQIKLDDSFKLINVEEYKYIVQSLITDDFKNLYVKKNENIRQKLFNHLKEDAYSLNDLQRLFNMLTNLFEPLFYFTETSTINIKSCFFLNRSIINNVEVKKWHMKYIIFMIKICRLFECAILPHHNIYKYWENKYNLHQRHDQGDINWDDNNGEGKDFYLKSNIDADVEAIKNGRFCYISNEFLNKYEKIFYDSNKESYKPNKTRKIIKTNNIISVC